MGLTHAFKGVDASGVAQFDASSMVAWRERENLDRIKAEDIQQAQVGPTVWQGGVSLCWSLVFSSSAPPGIQLPFFSTQPCFFFCCCGVAPSWYSWPWSCLLIVRCANSISFFGFNPFFSTALSTWGKKTQGKKNGQLEMGLNPLLSLVQGHSLERKRGENGDLEKNWGVLPLQ